MAACKLRGKGSKLCSILICFNDSIYMFQAKIAVSLSRKKESLHFYFNINHLMRKTWSKEKKSYHSDHVAVFFYVVVGSEPVLCLLRFCHRATERRAEPRAYRSVDMAQRGPVCSVPRAGEAPTSAWPGPWCTTSTGGHRARRAPLLYSSLPRGWRARIQLRGLCGSLPRFRTLGSRSLFGSCRSKF